MWHISLPIRWRRYSLLFDRTSLYLRGGQGTGHCPAGIFKNIISNVSKHEEAGQGLSPVRPVNCRLFNLVPVMLIIEV